MSAGKYDITIEQGATFSRVITWKDSTDLPINLTGYSARMQIRRTLKAEPTLLELSSPISGITLGGSGGTITITISAAVTDTLSGNGVYDLELVSGGGVVTRLLEGSVFIKPGVTR